MERRSHVLDSIRIGEPSTNSRLVYHEHLFTNAAVQADVADGRILVTLGSQDGGEVDLDRVAGVVDRLSIEDGRVVIAWRTIDTPSGALLDEMLGFGLSPVVRSRGTGIVENGVVSHYTLHSVDIVQPER